MELLNRGALAESLRRASALAVEYGIETSNLPSFAGAEAELLYETQRAVDDRYRALGAANIQSLVSQLPTVGIARQITCAGFLKLSPRLESIGGVHRSTEVAVGAAIRGDSHRRFGRIGTHRSVVQASDRR